MQNNSKEQSPKAQKPKTELIGVRIIGPDFSYRYLALHPDDAKTVCGRKGRDGSCGEKKGKNETDRLCKDIYNKGCLPLVVLGEGETVEKTIFEAKSR
ncbi:hypothetical protein C4559_02385 [Candidatus Microgenomates bacterium]|nr:MAG: hypothetical protein C4559_02385 [Candidatus Microgenomates bacterium]